MVKGYKQAKSVTPSAKLSVSKFDDEDINSSDPEVSFDDEVGDDAADNELDEAGSSGDDIIAPPKKRKRRIVEASDDDVAEESLTASTPVRPRLATPTRPNQPTATAKAATPNTSVAVNSSDSDVDVPPVTPSRRGRPRTPRAADAPTPTRGRPRKNAAKPSPQAAPPSSSPSADSQSSHHRDVGSSSGALYALPPSAVHSWPPAPPSSAPQLAEAVRATLADAGKQPKRAAASASAAGAVDSAVSGESLDWSSVGGLAGHIQALHEMVTLPLLCPQLFQDLGLSPPRGVLFTGPPGTGKTLTARALAATCSQLTGEPVAFFVRKGADCLSKWVGEAEKQLRLLFEEARARQPAIIFFDEIDGLAPVRSSQHDQSHTSVVATLLALMDGLESRGRVIVVGATNRVDAIDPALRRPGRFDRELLFSLPSLPARKDILAIHTRKWHPRPAPALIDSLAARTTGYCGADLKALCTEASLAAIRRAVPALYNPSLASMRSAAALPAVSAAQVAVLDPDFDVALAKIVPASRRVAPTPSVPLSPALHPLLHKRLTRALAGLRSVWPDSLVSQSSQTAAGSLPHASAVGVAATANLVRPRILIHGPRATGQRQVAAALLHEVDEFPCYDLSLPALVATGAPPEEAFLRLVREAQRAAPAVLFWPDVGQWWASASPVLRSVAAAALSQLPTGVAVLVVATAEQDLTDPADGQETPPELAWWAEVRPLFDSYAHMSEHVDLGTLNNKQVQGWAGQLLEKTVVAVLDGVAAAKTAKEAASTAIAAPTNPDTPTAASSSAPSSAPSASRALTVPLQSAEKLREQQRSDEVLILHLRMFLRSVAAHLAANFRDFTAPEVMALHTDRVPGMFFLRDAQLKVADSRYLSVREFLVDIDRSATAVKAHFTADTALGRTLLQRVGHMQDTALALCMGLDRDVLTACEVMAMRLRSQPGGFVPWPSLIFVPEDLPDASGSGAASDKPADTNANAPVDANAVKSSTASTAGAPPQLGTKAQALSSLFGKPSAPKPSAPATATPAVPAATQPKPAPARPSPRKSSAWEATKPLTTQLSRVHDVEQLETLWGRAQLCVPAAVKTVVERAKNVTELDAAIAAVVELVAAIPLKVKKSNKQV